MRSLAAIPLVLLCACSGVQKKTAVAVDVAAKTVELTAAAVTDTLDFGRVHEGETLVAQIALHNPGEKPVVILESETTCGCVEVDYPRKPVAPGDRAMMSVYFHTGGLAGIQIKHFALRTTLGPQRYRMVVVADVE